MLDDWHKGAPVGGPAAGALAKIGSRAVPALVEVLAGSPIKVRAGAIKALAAIGLPSGPAALRLKAIIDNRREPVYLRQRAAGALGAIGREADAALRECLENGKVRNTFVRISLAAALCRIGVAPALDIPVLRRALRDKDELNRAEAAEEIGTIGPKAVWAVPALIRSLGDRKPCVKLSASIALGKIGPAAKSAIPALRRVSRDFDASVSQAAANALGLIQPKPDK